MIAVQRESRRVGTRRLQGDRKGGLAAASQQEAGVEVVLQRSCVAWDRVAHRDDQRCAADHREQVPRRGPELRVEADDGVGVRVELRRHAADRVAPRRSCRPASPASTRPSRSRARALPARRYRPLPPRPLRPGLRPLPPVPQRGSRPRVPRPAPQRARRPVPAPPPPAAPWPPPPRSVPQPLPRGVPLPARPRQMSRSRSQAPSPAPRVWLPGRCRSQLQRASRLPLCSPRPLPALPGKHRRRQRLCPSRLLPPRPRQPVPRAERRGLRRPPRRAQSYRRTCSPP